MAEFEYPKVAHGDRVVYAPNEDTPESRWELAEVTRTKNNAIDLRLLTDGSRPRVDVRHIGDPSLIKIPPRTDSGVFRSRQDPDQAQ